MALSLGNTVVAASLSSTVRNETSRPCSRVDVVPAELVLVEPVILHYSGLVRLGISGPRRARRGPTAVSPVARSAESPVPPRRARRGPTAVSPVARMGTSPRP
jgi:hypothetical protein